MSANHPQRLTIILLVGSRQMAKRTYQRESVDAILDRLSEPTDSGCWKWNGKHGTHGYAYISYRIKPQERIWKKTATVAWELANAMEVPKGLEISHTCLQEWCVNPEHLIAETHSENLKRRRPFSRYKGNVCKNGHPLPPKEKRNKNGVCPICYKENQARYRAARKARKE